MNVTTKVYSYNDARIYSRRSDQHIFTPMDFIFTLFYLLFDAQHFHTIKLSAK